jgi:hypothetical protein
MAGAVASSTAAGRISCIRRKAVNLTGFGIITMFTNKVNFRPYPCSIGVEHSDSSCCNGGLRPNHVADRHTAGRLGNVSKPCRRSGPSLASATFHACRAGRVPGGASINGKPNDNPPHNDASYLRPAKRLHVGASPHGLASATATHDAVARRSTHGRRRIPRLFPAMPRLRQSTNRIE